MQMTIGNISKNTYSSKQLWAIHDQVNQQAWQTYHLDQYEELENFDLIENQQASEPEKNNISTQNGKLKSEISDRYQQLTKVMKKLSKQ